MDSTCDDSQAKDQLIRKSVLHDHSGRFPAKRLVACLCAAAAVLAFVLEADTDLFSVLEADTDRQTYSFASGNTPRLKGAARSNESVEKAGAGRTGSATSIPNTSASEIQGGDADTERPPVWAEYTQNQIWEHLDCYELFEKERPIHEQTEWKQMRKAYTDTVGAQHSTIGLPQLGFNGFAVPYYVNHNEYGRGIYATKAIPKDSLVWQNIRSAQFTDGPSYRTFLMRLPASLTCDIIQWAYVTKEPHRINVDLDEGSFANTGGLTHTTNIDINKGLSEQFLTHADMQLFATRDIKKGEELLCDYGSFTDGQEDWGHFGM